MAKLCVDRVWLCLKKNSNHTKPNWNKRESGNGDRRQETKRDCPFKKHTIILPLILQFCFLSSRWKSLLFLVIFIHRHFAFFEKYYKLVNISVVGAHREEKMFLYCHLVMISYKLGNIPKSNDYSWMPFALDEQYATCHGFCFLSVNFH